MSNKKAKINHIRTRDLNGSHQMEGLKLTRVRACPSGEGPQPGVPRYESHQL